MTVTRPVARYHGGKYRLAPWVIARLPPHRVYCEPFGGAFSVGLLKPRSFAEVYNDLDDEVVNVFRVLRDPEKAQQLRAACELTPFSRTEFLLAYEVATDPVERARRLLVRSWMGHGSSGVRKHKTGLRVDPHRQRTTAAGDWAGWPEAIHGFVERLRGVVIECRPARDLLASLDDAQTLFYVDPPYVFGSRSEKRKDGDIYHGYKHEMTDGDHEALLEQLIGLESMVVLSAYESAMYDERLEGWRKETRQARADRSGVRTEVIWMNPAATAALHAVRGGGPLFDPLLDIRMAVSHNSGKGVPDAEADVEDEDPEGRREEVPGAVSQDVAAG